VSDSDIMFDELELPVSIDEIEAAVDNTDPNNYRCISLVGNLGKLFTSVLNKRVLV
jgi:hypothetical protein